MDDLLPFASDEDFFWTHYFPALGLRGLAMIGLVTKKLARALELFVGRFGKHQLRHLCDAIDVQEGAYWLYRYLGYQPHLVPSTLVWSTRYPRGLVRIIGESQIPMGLLTIACDDIMVDRREGQPLCTTIVNQLQHYAILAPGLEMAVARMRFEEAAETHRRRFTD